MTYQCNYQCPFCYCVWHEYPELIQSELTTAEWKNIILKSINAGITEFTYSGGEALLRPDIEELLGFAGSLFPKARFALFTNGYLLTPRIISLLKQNNISIATSLQGIKTYGEMTGVTNGCNHILKMLKYASGINWPMTVSITVSSVNAKELLDMVFAASDNGASSITLGPIMLEGKARNWQELAITPYEWDNLKRKTQSLISVQAPISFVNEMICMCRPQPSKFRELYGQSFSHCNAGKSFAVISPSGKYRKCLHTIEEFPVPWL